jgi:hypothetical protein
VRRMGEGLPPSRADPQANRTNISHSARKEKILLVRVVLKKERSNCFFGRSAAIIRSSFGLMTSRAGDVS